MFLTVRQTQANEANLFQVEREGEVLYRAQTPWANLHLPFQMENLRKLILTDAQGKELFHTEYRVWENAAEMASRYKSFFGKSTRLAEYQVLDREGTLLGSFCARIDAPFTSQLVLRYQEREFDCYALFRGKRYLVCVFEEGRQIAQITKPLDTWNRLDIFYLHLLDSCGDLLPILSFFILYVDARQFHRPGKASAWSVEKRWSYSLNQNDRYYDPDWVGRTFGQEEALHLEHLLQTHPEKSTKRPSVFPNRRTLALLLVLAALILSLVIGVLVFLLRPKTAILPDDFTRRMEEMGYAVTETSSHEEWLRQPVYEARKGDCRIRLFTFVDEDAAHQAFSQTQHELEVQAGDSFLQTSTDLPHSASYTLTVGDQYFALSRIQDTLVTVTTLKGEKEEAKSALKSLGY